MEHKAFVFDTQRFFADLENLGIKPERKYDKNRLEEFLGQNCMKIRSPYTGEQLDESWKNELENGGLQELFDFMMALYYDPGEDMGLGNGWDALLSRIGGILSKKYAEHIVLGHPIEEGTLVIDPGGMGTGLLDALEIPKIYSDLAAIESQINGSYEVPKDGLLYPMSQSEIAKYYQELLTFFDKAKLAGKGALMTF